MSFQPTQKSIQKHAVVLSMRSELDGFVECDVAGMTFSDPLDDTAIEERSLSESLFCDMTFGYNKRRNLSGGSIVDSEASSNPDN